MISYVNSFLDKVERAATALRDYDWPEVEGLSSLPVEVEIGPAPVSKENAKLNIALLPDELTAVYEGYERPVTAPTGAVLEVVVWASTDLIDLLDMYRRYIPPVAEACKKEGFHFKEVSAGVEGNSASANHIIALTFTQVIV